MICLPHVVRVVWTVEVDLRVSVLQANVDLLDILAVHVALDLKDSVLVVLGTFAFEAVDVEELGDFVLNEATSRAAKIWSAYCHLEDRLIDVPEAILETFAARSIVCKGAPSLDQLVWRFSGSVWDGWRGQRASGGEENCQLEAHLDGVCLLLGKLL